VCVCVSPTVDWPRSKMGEMGFSIHETLHRSDLENEYMDAVRDYT